MKMTRVFDNPLTGRIAGMIAQLILAFSIFATNTARAAKVVAVDPQYGVKGSTVVVEGNLWTFSTTVTTTTNSNNKIATIKNPPANTDHYLSANPGTLNTTIYRYVQVFYSLASDFTGSVQQLFLATSNQSLGNVPSFLSGTSIPSTSGSHSFIIDLLDGTTSIGTNGYSGNLTTFRWDFWNDNIAGNDGKSMTLDRIVFASGLVAGPDKNDTVLLFDNFNTSNGSATNDLATRQTGTMAQESYDSALTISSGMLPVGSDANIACNADFKAHIKDTQVNGFKLSFDASYTGSSNLWFSPYLSTQNDPDERGVSKFGLMIYQVGQIDAYGTTNKSVGPVYLTNLLGSWNVAATNNYALVTTPATATNGTYDVFINGTEAISDVAYTIGTGGSNGEVNWQVRNPAGGGAKFDNLYVSTFVIPPRGTVLIIR